MGIIINNQLEEYRKYIKDKLSKKRYIHSIGVSDTCACLAMCHNENIDKARIAGMLHDVAKSYSGDELIKLCKKNKISITDIQRSNPELLHSVYGSFLAKTELKIGDKDILNAILNHTTGREGMSTLEKIVFIADYIEPNRSELPILSTIRKTSFESLDKAILLICESTINYLEESGKIIDDSTRVTYNYYKNIVNEETK